MSKIISTELKEIAIFIPTFNRASSLFRVITSLYKATPEGLFTPYLIIEKQDQASAETATTLRVPCIINEGAPCYADAINTAYRKTKEPYFFTGADDLGFRKDWLENAMGCLKDGISVVGTNDIGTIPIGEDRDATHYLVRRSYIVEQSGVIDIPDTVLYPYGHNWTDKEFIETAKMRGVYTYCPESVVEHLHWAWGKGQMDDTYRKGFNHDQKDRITFQQRQHLWTK